MRIIYHTEIKYLVRKGLLSLDLLKRIPKSNVYRWKNESEDKYNTFGLNLKGQQDYELLRAFANNKKAKVVFASYIRIIKLALTFSHQLKGFLPIMRENKLKLIDTVNRVRHVVGLKKSLRFFNISVFTFRQWSLETHTSCFQSLAGNCNRIFPNQLSNYELVKLKDMLCDTKFKYWPISSIAHYALKNNLLPLSINTWYKYVAKLGINRPKALSRRKRRSESIRTAQPNELWHADITEFITLDHTKHYIYLVVDNFSRKILSFLIESKIRKEFRRATILDAFKQLDNKNLHLTLLTDGGAENNFSDLNPSPHSLKHLKSFVDVRYSNSLIEAHNKILKYNYLYKMEINNGVHLKKIMEWIVDDYNNRPHVSLDGLSPNEKYLNQSSDINSRILYIQNATLARKLYNQKHRCDSC